MEPALNKGTADLGGEEGKISDGMLIHAGNDYEITDLETLSTQIIPLEIIIPETLSPKVILNILKDYWSGRSGLEVIVAMIFAIRYLPQDD